MIEQASNKLMSLYNMLDLTIERVLPNKTVIP